MRPRGCPLSNLLRFGRLPPLKRDCCLLLSGGGLLAAFLGGVVVGVVNAVLTMAFKEELGGGARR